MGKNKDYYFEKIKEQEGKAAGISFKNTRAL